MDICPCGREYKPAGFGEASRMCRLCAINRRRFLIKRKGVAYLGGECENCGYNKCVEALDFHHIDPTKKDFSIASEGTSWKKVQPELDKCKLLCATCHRELHWEAKKHKMEYLLDYRFIDERVITIKCKGCKKEMTGFPSQLTIYCSVKCSNIGRRKIEYPSLDELLTMLKTTPYIHVSSKLGVSDNAIRKHLKRNGIDPKTVRKKK